MTTYRTLLFLLAVFSVQPASAAPTPGAPPVAEPSTSSVAAVEAEMTAYGRWLTAFRDIEAPVQATLAQLGPAWESALAEGTSPQEAAVRMRPVIAGVLTAVDGADARLEALELLEFSQIDLPAEFRPVALRAAMLRVNREIRTAIENFNPMIDALIRNDADATIEAGNRMLASFRLVLESQIVLTRATLAGAPRDQSAWNVVNLQLLYFEVGARAFAGFRPWDRDWVDRDLSRDLLAFATRLEANARQGEERAAAELSAYSAALTDSERGTDDSAASVLRRVIAITRGSGDYFILSREMAASLRPEAAALRGNPMNQERFGHFFGLLREARARMEEIARRQNAALAGDGE